MPWHRAVRRQARASLSPAVTRGIPFMATSPLRVGIVGAHPERGWAQAAHIPALLRMPEFRLQAVATTRQESAEATAQRHGVPQAFGDWRRMLAEAELDVVIVAVKVPFHREIVLAAAEAGRHVFCEWPLGLDAGEAEAMLAAVEARGLRHMVGLQSHVHPTLVQARDLIAGGAIGKVVSATLVSSLNNWAPVVPAAEAYRMDARHGATALTVPGGHSLDALAFCVGGFAELSAIAAPQQPAARIVETGETIPFTAPTQVLVTGRLTCGAVASVHVKADIRVPTGVRLEINGTRGDLVIATHPPVGRAPVGIQRVALTLHAALDGGRELLPVEVPDPDATSVAAVPEGAPRFTARLLRRFAAAVVAGGATEPDFRTARDLHRLLDAIQEASRSGRTQFLSGRDVA